MTDPKADGNQTTAPGLPRHSPGTPVVDGIRESSPDLLARAQEISQETGSRMSAALKELITTAASLAGFAIESARDLIQFMVRRGQMTADEAEKLLKEVEAAQPKKKAAPPASPAPVRKTVAATGMPHSSEESSGIAPRRTTPGAASTRAGATKKADRPAKAAPAAGKTPAPSGKRAASAKASAPAKSPASAKKPASAASKNGKPASKSAPKKSEARKSAAAPARKKAPAQKK